MFLRTAEGVLDFMLIPNFPEFVLYRSKAVQFSYSLRIGRIFCGVIGIANMLKTLQDKVAVLYGKSVRH